MAPILIRHATTVSGQQDVLVRNGRIEAIAPQLEAPEGAETIHASGQLLLPGIVDLEVHVGEPGRESCETFASLRDSAMAGGITTLLAHPDTDPVIDDPAMLTLRQYHAERAAPIAILPLAGMTQEQAGDELVNFGMLQEQGAAGFTDNGSLASSGKLERAMRLCADLGTTLYLQPQDNGLAGLGCVHDGVISARLGLTGIPPEAETIALSRDLQLGKRTGCPIHILQISTAGSVELLRQAKAHGQRVTCSVNPAHLLLTDAALEGFNTLARLTPPLRSEADRQALLEGVRDGTIDALTSAHQPRTPEAKDTPVISAASGMIGVEALLSLALRLQQYGIALPRIQELLCSAPARIAGLTDRGELSIGQRADIICVNTSGKRVLNMDTILSRSRNTPFLGQELQGTLHWCMIDGMIYPATESV